MLIDTGPVHLVELGHDRRRPSRDLLLRGPYLRCRTAAGQLYGIAMKQDRHWAAEGGEECACRFFFLDGSAIFPAASSASLVACCEMTVRISPTTDICAAPAWR